MSRRGWVLFAVMGLIWGIPYLLIKVADGGVAVPVLVFARVFAGSMVLLPLAMRRSRLRSLRCPWRWLVAFAAVDVIVPWLLLSDAERRLSSSLSGLLVAAAPVLGIAAAKLAGDTGPLTFARWAGLVTGLGGVALLMGPGASGGGARPILEVLGTALCYAIGPVIADRKLAATDSLAATAACLGLAAVVYAPAAALTWPHAMPSTQELQIPLRQRHPDHGGPPTGTVTRTGQARIPSMHSRLPSSQTAQPVKDVRNDKEDHRHNMHVRERSAVSARQANPQAALFGAAWECPDRLRAPPAVAAVACARARAWLIRPQDG